MLFRVIFFTFLFSGCAVTPFYVKFEHEGKPVSLQKGDIVLYRPVCAYLPSIVDLGRLCGVRTIRDVPCLRGYKKLSEPEQHQLPLYNDACYQFHIFCENNGTPLSFNGIYSFKTKDKLPIPLQELSLQGETWEDMLGNIILTSNDLLSSKEITQLRKYLIPTISGGYYTNGFVNISSETLEEKALQYNIKIK